ncbi:hypothetical protein CPB86DRAFT_743632 [Serendipita vermifera]|nr:hypothetical protein CPB86DRAFT_743632 [Serendipita vermifera]
MQWINISRSKIPASSSGEWARLTEIRWRYLDEIIQVMQDGKGNVKAEAIISSYNEVVDALQNLDVGPRVDPMDKLPREIVTYIMLEYSTYTFSWHTSRMVYNLIQLTMVSKRWRGFLLSEPLLWNSISLGKRSYAHSIALMQLKITKDLPLTLEIDLPFEKWNSIRSDIIKHRDRIETIVVSGSYSYEGRLERDKDIQKILEDLGSLPSLRRFGGRYLPFSEVWDTPWIIEHCHSLKELINIPINTQDLRATKQRLTFRELNTYERLEIILPVAETIKELRKVAFLTGYSTFSSDETEKTHPRQVPLSTRPLSWTHLTYSRYDSMIPKPLLHRLPNLVILEINADLHTLQYFVSIADQFPNLSQFNARTSLRTQDEIVFPDNIATNPNVHRLELFISRGEDYRFRVENNPDFHQQCQSVHIVPEMPLHAMPNAKYLNLSISGMFSKFPFFSLEDCFTGKEIYLSFSECGAMPMPNSRIPASVERLSVACDRAIVCSLSSKTLRSLAISEMHFTKEETFAPSSALPMLDLSTWPSLEVISFYDNWITWSKYSLTSLKKVSIQRRYGSSNLHNDVTSFVRDIARSPEPYPSLETLEFGVCPEWDIFIIMLERRNLLANRGVARITELMMYSPCPVQIHHVITQLVMGKWTERPSNKELSISGNAERMLDLSLPGCYSCHKALRQCETPVKTNWQPEPDYHEKVFLTRLQEYPDSEDEILNTWEERAQLWANWNRNGARELTCGR